MQSIHPKVGFIKRSQIYCFIQYTYHGYHSLIQPRFSECTFDFCELSYGGKND